MAEGFAGAKKEINAGAQAVAAVVAVGGVLGGAWGLGEFFELGHSPKDVKPAVCSTTKDELPAEYASGAKLCAALNRPDLPALLGTPAEQPLNATGNGRWITFGSGVKIAASEAKVQLKTHTVQVSASYDDLPVDQAVEGLGVTGQQQTVLGHPAVVYSYPTIAITFNFGNGKSGSGPGGTARHVMVAADAKGGGGTAFDVVVWREDGTLPDDVALLRVAEQVLPTVPGWSAG
ncbi:DUF6215 domain-containing protein [Streptomyces goshikiensis]|uniref:DUF6215 domain-containing protein n=1 Tax=Streptomyces goshikiensis TaxID=1942 RepID=UPI0036739AE4